MNLRIKALIMLFTTSLIWGVAFVAQLAGMQHVGPLTYGGVRFLLGAASLVPVALVFEKNGWFDRKTVTYGVATGLVLFAASTLQQYGVALTNSAGKAGFITSLYIVAVPITGTFVGRRAGIGVWLGAATALSGVYLLSVREGFGMVGMGDLLLLIGVIFWTAHILVIDRWARKVYPIRYSITQFLICGIINLALAFTFEEVSLSGIAAGCMPIIYGGLLSVGIAYTLQIMAQRHVPPAQAAIIFSLESLFAALGAAVILGERMDTRGYIGCLLIFAGILVSQLVSFKSKTAKNTIEIC